MEDRLPSHEFCGTWITDEEFFCLEPRNVFHRQLDRQPMDCSEHRNRHILFRKTFVSDESIERACMYISADDYYKLYINGRFVAQGPAASYHFRYNYNEIDVTPYLRRGKNVIAVHTLYQGLINRVWQSGDCRHGLILDLNVNERCVVCSDETFKVATHSAYHEVGVVGYDTGFLEDYDSEAAEVGFEQPEFRDTDWKFAKVSQTDDRHLVRQTTALLTFETIRPKTVRNCKDGSVLLDFGSVYVGYLYVKVRGSAGDRVVIRMGQELEADGCVRYKLRANCTYEETWRLADGISTWDPYDDRSFRYAQLKLPATCNLEEVFLRARHYPFALKADPGEAYANDPAFRQIWDLCVHTQRYGVQEAVLDCMEREKGFYLGDGCYTALTNMILTGDDVMVRKLIDDAFASSFITDGLVTCLNCSFIQEIAEYPLMLVKLIAWHYRYTGDIDYLRINYPKVVRLLEVYRRDYETDGLLCNLDKWCVVEWPAAFRDGYDVDIREGKVCTESHVVIQAYYIEAIRVANRIASELSLPPYRDTTRLCEVFHQAFYLPDQGLFRDGVGTDHISLIGNLFPFAFELCPDERCRENIWQMLQARKIRSVSLFGAFPWLEGLVRNGLSEHIAETLRDEGAWLRMLAEGATTTFEGWGKETKQNTSLFHLTMSYAAVFLADIDLERLFDRFNKI